MGVVHQFRDRLVNLMTGQGTSNDQRIHAFHVLQRLTPQQIEAGYRTSWLMRNAVDIPAYDMTRAWRDWQADDEQIEAIEVEERRLGLREKVRRALILGRLGGGAIILGLRDNAPALPIPATVAADALSYVTVMSRHQLNLGPIVRDPGNPLFGEPEWFEVRGAGTQVRIHPSRVIAFKGQQVPDMGVAWTEDCYWGDPIAQAIQEAVNNADLAQAGFASLISKARLDIIKMPDLMANAATAEYEQRFMERMRLAGLGSSTHQALVIDAAEDWQQRQVTWAGMPDIIQTYLAIVAGATGIPATRLLGKAPDGMNATGEGDERNYNAMVSGRQENELRPLLERIDAVMLPSLGINDPDAVFAFAPLSVLSEKERADIAFVKAQAIAQYADRNLIPTIALEKGVQNMLVEDELLPGLDGALAELSEEERFPSLDQPDNTNPAQPEGGDLNSGREVGDKPGLPFGDAYDPDEARDPNGQWSIGAILQHVARALASGREHSTTSLGKVSHASAEKVRQHTGVSIHGHERVLQSGDIRHVMNSHGDTAREARRGQVAIKKADFERIPAIVEQAHTITSEGDRSSRKGLRLTYHANVGGHAFEYTEMVQSNRIVALKAMRKK